MKMMMLIHPVPPLTDALADVVEIVAVAEIVVADAEPPSA